MKVAIVHDWLTGMRGGERVLEVFCRVFPEADIFTLFFFPDRISETIKTHTVISSNLQKVPFSKKYYRYLLPFFPGAIESFDLRHYDLVISTSHAVAKGAITGGGVSVCYCHTPMRYIWDMFDTYFSDGRRFSLRRLPALWIRDYLRWWDKKTSDRVDYFIANSKHVSHRIRKFYDKNSTVIHPPVDTSFYHPGDTDPEDFYLIVSALAPYKRIDIAIEAFLRLKKRLVIIGAGTEEEKLKKLAAGSPNIQFKGYIGDDKIVRDFYRRCKALIFPGVEDFGLTPVECQACGRPVVAYARGGALETVIEGITGHFFHEQSATALARAVREFEELSFAPDVMYQWARAFDTERMLDRLKMFFRNISENTLNDFR